MTDDNTLQIAHKATNQHEPETQAIRLAQEETAPGAGEMACPACGSAMPDLKGGRATICPVCGFKDSCCF